MIGEKVEVENKSSIADAGSAVALRRLTVTGPPVKALV